MERELGLLTTYYKIEKKSNKDVYEDVVVARIKIQL